MRPGEIVERIMAEHWDMAACRCWVCIAGRKLGLGAMEKYMSHTKDYKAPEGESLKEYYEELLP